MVWLSVPSTRFAKAQLGKSSRQIPVDVAILACYPRVSMESLLLQISRPFSIQRIYAWEEQYPLFALALHYDIPLTETNSPEEAAHQATLLAYPMESVRMSRLALQLSTKEEKLPWPVLPL